MSTEVKYQNTFGDVMEQGVTFKEACGILKKQYLSQDRAWASFGAYDLNISSANAQQWVLDIHLALPTSM